MAAVVQLAEE